MSLSPQPPSSMLKAGYGKPDHMLSREVAVTALVEPPSSKDASKEPLFSDFVSTIDDGSNILRYESGYGEVVDVDIKSVHSFNAITHDATSNPVIHEPDLDLKADVEGLTTNIIPNGNLLENSLIEREEEIPTIPDEEDAFPEIIPEERLSILSEGKSLYEGAVEHSASKTVDGNILGQMERDSFVQKAENDALSTSAEPMIDQLGLLLPTVEIDSASIEEDLEMGDVEALVYIALDPALYHVQGTGETNDTEDKQQSPVSEETITMTPASIRPTPISDHLADDFIKAASAPDILSILEQMEQTTLSLISRSDNAILGQEGAYFEEDMTSRSLLSSKASSMKGAKAEEEVKEFLVEDVEIIAVKAIIPQALNEMVDYLPDTPPALLQTTILESTPTYSFRDPIRLDDIPLEENNTSSFDEFVPEPDTPFRHLFTATYRPFGSGLPTTSALTGFSSASLPRYLSPHFHFGLRRLSDDDDAGADGNDEWERDFECAGRSVRAS
ncbi:hypothetical protein HDU67_006796 [Dinochytrium kinnereticum]|nr:hypothetical protein HDU67_006796 [Dinochytrium kinnereticum]